MIKNASSIKCLLYMFNTTVVLYLNHKVYLKNKTII